MKRVADTPIEKLEEQVSQTKQETTAPVQSVLDDGAKGAEHQPSTEEQKQQTKQEAKGMGDCGRGDWGKKMRLAILCGYNGINFHGSQKNKGVRTVEEEIEKVFFKLGLISEFNFGDLKKIGWGRATRTDKRVHALVNTFSAKILLPRSKREMKGSSMEETMDDLRKSVNKELPDDVRIFCFLPVSNRFNAKNCTSHREYSYFLPTFMLQPIQQIYLASPPSEDEDATDAKVDAEESKEPVQVVTQMSSGVKRILRKADEQDEVDPCENFLDRNIDHISKEYQDKIYATRLSAEQRTNVSDLFKQFLGTKKYHNYTKEVRAHEMAAQRYMMELRADEYMYVNRHSFEATDSSDPDALEFVHFYLKGQSFLFNQIRKMIGCIVQVCHGNLNSQFVANTHKDNVLQVALAPGDGLLLEKVAYDKYNMLPSTQEPIMLKLVSQKKEVDEYRVKILSYIARREITEKAFTCWLSWFDDNKEDYYVSLDAKGAQAQEVCHADHGEVDLPDLGKGSNE